MVSALLLLPLNLSAEPQYMIRLLNFVRERTGGLGTQFWDLGLFWAHSTMNFPLLHSEAALECFFHWNPLDWR